MLAWAYPAGPGSWQDVCSASGPVRLALSDAAGRPVDPTGSHHLLDHCPLCALGADRLGPPSAPLSWRDGPAGEPVGPAHPVLVVPRRLALHLALPRGPPLLA